MGDERTNRRREASAGRKHQMYNSSSSVPCRQHMHEPPRRQGLGADMIGEKGAAESLDRGLPDGRHVAAAQAGLATNKVRASIVGFQVPFDHLSGVVGA